MLGARRKKGHLEKKKETPNCKALSNEQQNEGFTVMIEKLWLLEKCAFVAKPKISEETKFSLCSNFSFLTLVHRKQSHGAGRRQGAVEKTHKKVGYVICVSVRKFVRIMRSTTIQTHRK